MFDYAASQASHPANIFSGARGTEK